MAEPRPHWDASLISAVLADLRDVYDSGYGEEQAFRIIAAVEDWARWEHVPKGTLLRLERAEAAIARVRALAEHASTVIARGCTCCGDDCTGCRRGEPMGWDLDPVKVLAALDGER